MWTKLNLTLAILILLFEGEYLEHQISLAYTINSILTKHALQQHSTKIIKVVL